MDTYTVTRSATVAAPPEKVYAEIVDLRRMEKWSPWERMDPNMTKTYSGAESGVGQHYAWSGNRKVGEGSMVITDAKENEKVEMALEFVKPFKAQNTSWMELQPQDGGTRVTWGLTGKKTLMTRIMGIFKSMDSMMGPDFEQGLDNLKQVVEN